MSEQLVSDEDTEFSRVRRNRRLVTPFVLLLIFGSTVGEYAAGYGGYLPSALGRDLCIGAAVAGSIAGAIFGHFVPNFTTRVALKKAPLVARVWILRVSVSAAAAALFSWYSSIAVGWGFTEIAGRPAEQTVTYAGWHNGDRGSCSGPYVLEASYTNPICLNDSSLETTLVLAEKFFVYGKGTALGIDVTKVRVPAPSPLPPLRQGQYGDAGTLDELMKKK